MCSSTSLAGETAKRPRGIPVTKRGGINDKREPFTDPQDRAMLEMIALGYNCAQAAAAGGYASERSVKQRLHKLYEISGMNSLASLIAYCFRNGYLT